MFWKTTLVIAVFAVELSPCYCQFGGGEMGGGMAEMMGGNMGGLGAMMGGNTGGLGAMLGSMGGMGAMGGGGSGVGGMGSAIGAMIRQGAMAGAMNSINEAIHFIVGPQANPDQILIDYGVAQRGPPRTMTAMLGYLPHFQRIARAAYGPWLVSMAVDTPVSSSSNATASTSTAGATASTSTAGATASTSTAGATASTSTAGATASTSTAGAKSLTQLQVDLDAVIMQRSVQYMDRIQGQGGAGMGGAMGAAGMAGIQMMIPQMIQGIAGAYM